MLQPRLTDRANGLSGYVAVSFDGFTLLFDQGEITGVEQSDRLEAHDGGVATYRENGLETRVFALSKALRPMANSARPIFVLARHRSGRFGLACDEVRVLAASRIRLGVIPASLRSGRSPIEAYARLGEQVMFQCSAGALAALLAREEDNERHGNEQSSPA
jgi:hypothetical protein